MESVERSLGGRINEIGDGTAGERGKTWDCFGFFGWATGWGSMLLTEIGEPGG